MHAWQIGCEEFVVRAGRQERTTILKCGKTQVLRTN